MRRTSKLENLCGQQAGSFAATLMKACMGAVEITSPQVEDVAESKSGSRSGRMDVKFRKPVDAERTLEVQEVVGK